MLGMQTGHAAGGQKRGCVLHGHPCRQGWRRQAARLSDQQAPPRARVSEGSCGGAQACKRPWCPTRSASIGGLRLCCLPSLKPQNWGWKQMQRPPSPTSDLPAQGWSSGPETRHPANHQVQLMHCLPLPLQTRGQLAPPKSKPPPSFSGWLHGVPHCSSCLAVLQAHCQGWPSTNGWLRSALSTSLVKNSCMVTQ